MAHNVTTMYALKLGSSPKSLINFAWLVSLSPLLCMCLQAAEVGQDDFSSQGDGPIATKARGIGWDLNEITQVHTGTPSDWDAAWGTPTVGDVPFFQVHFKRDPATSVFGMARASWPLAGRGIHRQSAKSLALEYGSYDLSSKMLVSLWSPKGRQGDSALPLEGIPFTHRVRFPRH